MLFSLYILNYPSTISFRFSISANQSNQSNQCSIKKSINQEEKLQHQLVGCSESL